MPKASPRSEARAQSVGRGSRLGFKHHRGGGQARASAAPEARRQRIAGPQWRAGPGVQQGLQPLTQGCGVRREGLPQIGPVAASALLPHRRSLLKPVLIETLEGMVDERCTQLRFRQRLGHGALCQIALKPRRRKASSSWAMGPRGKFPLYAGASVARSSRRAPSRVRFTAALLLGPKAFGGRPSTAPVPGERPQRRALELKAARRGGRLSRLAALGQRRPERLASSPTLWATVSAPRRAQCAPPRGPPSPRPPAPGAHRPLGGEWAAVSSLEVRFYLGAQFPEGPSPSGSKASTLSTTSSRSASPGPPAVAAH